MTREIRELRQAAMRASTDDELWGDLGDALRANGDLAAAVQSFLRAWHIDPSDSEWQRNLVELGAGAVLLDTMRANLNESDDESLGDLADALMMEGSRDEACELYRRAAELDPSDTEWLNHATECGFPVPEGYVSDYGYGEPPYGYEGMVGLLEGGVVGGVIGSSESGGVYELPEPDDVADLSARLAADAQLLVKLGQAQLRAGDRTGATTNLWNALLVDHDDTEALQSWMVAAGKTRREALEKLRDAFPDDDEVVGLLADHYLDLGLRDRARDLYDLAHRLDEDDPEWKAKRTLLGAAP
jgi:tetratricopeptide (TPR) repeat protein